MNTYNTEPFVQRLDYYSTKTQGKECPVCHKWITNPMDYIYSKRILDCGFSCVVELCRSCRDAEMTEIP